MSKPDKVPTRPAGTSPALERATLEVRGAIERLLEEIQAHQAVIAALRESTEDHERRIMVLEQKAGLRPESRRD